MEYVCAFFDVQGFYFNDKFYPREAALLGTKSLVHLSINNELTMQKLNHHDQRICNYLSNMHHGLNLSATKQDGSSIAELKETIKIFYHFAHNEEKFLVACKSCEAERMLRELDIPRINLLEYGGTCREIDDGNRSPCHLHTICRKAKVNCSLNLVVMMKKWYMSDVWNIHGTAWKNKNNNNNNNNNNRNVTSGPNVTSNLPSAFRWTI